MLVAGTDGFFEIKRSRTRGPDLRHAGLSVRVHIGGDHAAYDLLVDLVGHLEGQGHEVINHGPARL